MNHNELHVKTFKPLIYPLHISCYVIPQKSPNTLLLTLIGSTLAQRKEQKMIDDTFARPSETLIPTRSFICKVKHEGTNKCQTFFLSLYKLQLSGTVERCHSPPSMLGRNAGLFLSVCGRDKVSPTANTLSDS